MCLVGSLILSGSDASAFAQVRGLVRKDSFYQADHSEIYDVLCSMHDKKVAIDSVTLLDALKRRGMLEAVGGSEYLGKILNTVPSAAHFLHYARIVADKFKWRELIRMSNDMLRQAYVPRRDDCLDEADAVLGSLAADAARLAATGRASQVHKLCDVLPEVMAVHKTGELQRVPTGFFALDDAIGGLPFGQKVIIGGRPYMGKSALIKILARHVAGMGYPTGIISVEEKRQKIAANLLSGESGVINNRIVFGTASEFEWNEVEQAAQPLSELPLYIVDSARKLSSIIAMVNVLVAQYECRAIFVDHLHIIDGEPSERENREREISKISAELKWVWKDLNVIGVEAAQLNRGGGRDKPELTHLRDSGSLEQDADIIILLHREDYYRRNEPDFQPDRILELFVAKNKDSAAARIPLVYDEARFRMIDLCEGMTPVEAARDAPTKQSGNGDPTEGMF